MSIARLLTAVIAGMVISSCATISEETPAPGHDRVTAETVLHRSPLLAGVDPVDYSGIDILEMTPEMKVFIDAYVQGANNRYARMKRLVFAVMGDDRFELVYDDRTRTAAETFREQHGNCLSFTNLFIAMARYLDIHASYQEVDIPPDWSLAGESFLFSQHVNVELDLGADVIRVVDFNNYDFDADFDRRIISDQRARAHYFSNLGVDHLLEGETFLAVSNFLQALREDPGFVPAWINIGILHRREGFPDFAEAAWLQALEIDGFSLVAMSNLANLYEQEGRQDEAEYYENRVASHRMSNPYYRYQLAQNAVMEGDYPAAIGHLKFAVRKRENEDRFYSLLSVSYLLNGDGDSARKWMRKAEEVASADADKMRYHNKLDRLMSQGMRRNGVQ